MAGFLVGYSFRKMPNDFATPLFVYSGDVSDDPLLGAPIRGYMIVAHRRPNRASPYRVCKNCTLCSDFGCWLPIQEHFFHVHEPWTGGWPSRSAEDSLEARFVREFPMYQVEAVSYGYFPVRHLPTLINISSFNTGPVW
jgi:hypothetical protein